VDSLVPEGLVKIEGELWVAKSADKKIIDVGAEVIVIEQHGLKLVVRESKTGNLEGAE